MPYSYFESNQNRLKAVPILGGEKAPSKNPVSPSRETVIDTTYYPLSRPIFIYVSASAYERSEVKAFSEFYLKNAQNLANQVQYVGLSERAYSIGLKNMELKKTGTAFGGHNEVGVNVEHILDREKI